MVATNSSGYVDGRSISAMTARSGLQGSAFDFNEAWSPIETTEAAARISACEKTAPFRRLLVPWHWHRDLQWGHRRRRRIARGRFVGSMPEESSGRDLHAGIKAKKNFHSEGIP